MNHRTRTTCARRPARTARPRPRRASVYILVLGTAAIATAAGLGGIYVQRTHLRAARTAADMDRARLLAASGLEYAMARIGADSTWRTSLGAGNWLNAAALGPGTLTVAVSDPTDADILDSDSEPIRIVSTATVGSATQALSADVNMTKAAYTALACGAYGHNGVNINLATFTSDGVLGSGAGMTALVATVNAPAQAAGLATGLTFAQSVTSNAPARTVPPSSIADTWAAMGTTIPYASIPSRQLENVLIAPSRVTLGATMGASGIYVIDCGNNALTIRNLRVYGTLVILNCTDLKVTQSVRFDPITTGYPSLIVEGPAAFQVVTTALSEATINLNLNPTGVPWLGTTNTTKTNTYPCGFSGVVLVTGDVTVSQPLTITGNLTSLGSLTIGNTTSITTDPNITATPAPNFYTITPTLSSTGVARVIY